MFPERGISIPNLRSGLVDYWPLTEQSGNRSSLTGQNDLTDNATVTGNPGLFGQASQFTAASSEFLSHADSDALSGDGETDMCWWGWGLLDSNVSSTMIAKWNTTGNQREYQMRYNSATTLVDLILSNAGTANDIAVSATTFGALSLSTWYLLSSFFSGANNLVGVAVNNVWTFSAYTGGIFNGTADFQIGRLQASTNHWNGRMAGVGMAKRAFLPSEWAYIFNNGLGRPLFFS